MFEYRVPAHVANCCKSALESALHSTATACSFVNLEPIKFLAAQVANCDASCRIMVELLAMAHERGCESELADQLAVCLQHKQLPEIAALRMPISEAAPLKSRLGGVRPSSKSSLHSKTFDVLWHTAQSRWP